MEDQERDHERSTEEADLLHCSNKRVRSDEC